MAVKYHKVKFFDRQKTLRKIKSTKRQLEDSELDKKARKKVEKDLFEHRVNLNYIVHFPKNRKYVALFPSTTQPDPSTSEAGASSSKTDAVREEIRTWVRSAMKAGELPIEPEEVLGKHDVAHPPGAEAGAGLVAEDEDADEDADDSNEDEERGSSDAAAVAEPLSSRDQKKKEKHSADLSSKKTLSDTPLSTKAKKSKKDPNSKTNLTLEGDEFFE